MATILSVCPGPPRRARLEGDDVVTRPEVAMRSTMMDVPLLVSRILTHGTTVHASSEAVTWTADGPRRTSYAEVGRTAARLAHALHDLGVTGDQRVGTFMWNNAEHLAVYLAVPSMGAVLHPVNIRLFPEQLAYVVNHAEDQVVVLDATLAPGFAKLLP
ncbi:MAG TPA: AMP-binding protein, partial [Kineosporiaceae bacterium]|nr:AMP-binding protein [Kineosporiaceae bacterium]